MMIKKSFFKLFILITQLTSFVSCEQVIKLDVSVPIDEISFKKSSLSFSGISSIDTVTSTTAVVHWTHVVGAAQYQVYKVSGSSITLLASVNAPAVSYNLTGLTPQTTTTYRVRLIDTSGGSDTNANDVSITTDAIPNAPSSISLITPSTSPSYEDTPTFRVSGVQPGDTVKIFTDSSCTNEIGEETSLGVTASISTTAPLSTGSYTIYANTANSYTSPCSSVSVSYQLLAWPFGASEYIHVPANGDVGAHNDFYVMKYEAKAWNDVNGDEVVDTGEVDADGCNEPDCSTTNWGLATHKPLSVQEGKPWRRIAQNDAWASCDSLNTENDRASIDSDIDNNGTYALISNPEWMAIARNVEIQPANWTDGAGANGTGCLKRGNSGGDHPCSGGDSGYNGDNPDAGNSRGVNYNGTAELVLSNGRTIWDLSGNVWEWTDWTLGSPLVQVGTKALEDGETAPRNEWWEFYDLTVNTGAGDDMPPHSWQPTNSSLLKDRGIGAYFPGTGAGGAAARGCRWSSSSDYNNIGVFALYLNRGATHGYEDIGFRCVFRPPF